MQEQKDVSSSPARHPFQPDPVIDTVIVQYYVHYSRQPNKKIFKILEWKVHPLLSSAAPIFALKSLNDSDLLVEW